MSREIKFRAWDRVAKAMSPAFVLFGEFTLIGGIHAWQDHVGVKMKIGDSLIRLNDLDIMQYTGLKDKNGKEIYEGDILEFADKWEWYKTSYGIKMRFADGARLTELQEMYDAEPMERRLIALPEDYEWLLSGEIQTCWHVIGNIYENPELLNPSPMLTLPKSKTV